VASAPGDPRHAAAAPATTLDRVPRGSPIAAPRRLSPAGFVLPTAVHSARVAPRLHSTAPTPKGSP
jgi:hypothetical protein